MKLKRVDKLIKISDNLQKKWLDFYEAQSSVCLLHLKTDSIVNPFIGFSIDGFTEFVDKSMKDISTETYFHISATLGWEDYTNNRKLIVILTYYTKY